MTDATFSGREVERALVELGRTIDYPPDPPIASVVRRRIEAAPRRPSAWESFIESLKRPAFAAVAAVVAVSVFLIVSEPARIAVADWLGFDDVRITFDKPPAEPVAGSLGLGESVSLDEAEDSAGFHVLVPTALGAPDEVYFDERVSIGMVSLVYAARDDLPEAGGEGAGLIVTQFEASLDDSEVFTKFVNFDTSVSEVQVRGVLGYWISGPHELFFRDNAGEERFEASRLVGRALVWQAGDRVIRIESGLSRDEALEVAESLE
jgi:hypothetical protein